MLPVLGAASSLIDAIQSLMSSQKGPSTQTGPSANTPFDLGSGVPGPSMSSPPVGGASQISPQTMGALIAAQGQSGATGATSLSRGAALRDLFSRLDANGDGKIDKAEFEKALGAGGTNLAAADDVFSKLDRNGDGAVGLGELSSALGGGHHGHHIRAGGVGGTHGGDGAGAIAGASSTSVTNGDGSTTTTITYADGSKVSLTTPASSTSSASNAATSSYNFVEQMILRQAQMLGGSAGGVTA